MQWRCGSRASRSRHFTLTLQSASTPHAPLTDLEVVHQRRFHLFVVSDDLSVFEHLDPVPEGDPADGVWSVDETPPAPGRYWLYADLASKSLGRVVLREAVDVQGMSPPQARMVADATLQKIVGDMTVVLVTTPSPIAPGDVTLTYTLRDGAGAPVTDLEPYLGAFGHIFILSGDKITVARAHPQGAEPAAGSHGGPDVVFHTTLPKDGGYRIWAQFKRAGKVVTAPFTVGVH